MFFDAATKYAISWSPHQTISACSHEFYTSEIATVKKKIRDICSECPEKLIFLDKQTDLVDGFRIIGEYFTLVGEGVRVVRHTAEMSLWEVLIEVTIIQAVRCGHTYHNNTQKRWVHVLTTITKHGKRKVLKKFLCDTSLIMLGLTRRMDVDIGYKWQIPTRYCAFNNTEHCN